MSRRIFWLAMLLALVAAPVLAQTDEGETLTVVGHDSFAYSQAVLDGFTAQTGITVEVLRLGDAGTMVNQLILSKDAPLADVVYGVDNTFLSRALDADLFVPYESPALADVTDEFVLDADHRVTPVDYGDVCLNYDTSHFLEHDLAVPDSLQALTDPTYKSLLVVENPAISSPGLAFLLATIGAFGTEGDYTYLDYWADLTANDVLVVDDWTTAYYTEFSGSAESVGDRPLVVSYASSPPVEVYFMETRPETPPTGAVVADQMCFRQIEFVGILQSTQHLEAAQQFVDFMLSREFQEDMPLNMFVFPVNPAAELPDVFTEYAAIPEHPVTIDYAEIEANREDWLQAWTETVLR
jgi:thiamine transport system substrate-binding protein